MGLGITIPIVLKHQDLENKLIMKQPKLIKRIILVQPNLKWIDWNWKTSWDLHPYSLCLLGAMIRDQYDVQVVDAYLENYSGEDFKKLIADLKPDLVGITMMTNEYLGAAHTAASLVREVDPDIITVIGGVYATVSYKAIHDDTNFDYICIGEGEYVFPELLNYLNGDASFPATGFLGRKEGEKTDPVTVVRAPFIQDLDSIPYPAWDLVDYKRYINDWGKITIDHPYTYPYTRLMSSRGCPIGCTFCEVEAISGGPFRYRSVENVINELKWLQDEYDLKSFMLDDDNFFINRKRVIEFCNSLIDQEMNIEWKAHAVAVFHMSDEVIELMAKSGCTSVNVAIESGSERVLKEIIHKPVKIEKAREMSQKIKDAGMDLIANFIIGFPTETWEEIRQTFNFAEELPLDYAKFFIATPLEGTELHKMVMDSNLLISQADTSGQMLDLDWQTSNIRSEEWTIQDLTILRGYEWERINFATPEKREKLASMMNISLEALDKLRKDTFRSVSANIMKINNTMDNDSEPEHNSDHRAPGSQTYPGTTLGIETSKPDSVNFGF